MNTKRNLFRRLMKSDSSVCANEIAGQARNDDKKNARNLSGPDRRFTVWEMAVGGSPGGWRKVSAPEPRKARKPGMLSDIPADGCQAELPIPPTHSPCNVNH